MLQFDTKLFVRMQSFMLICRGSGGRLDILILVSTGKKVQGRRFLVINGGTTKCEVRGSSGVMSKNIFFFFFWGGQKKILITTTLTSYAGPSNVFRSGGGGGLKYLRSGRAKQSKVERKLGSRAKAPAEPHEAQRC